MNEQLQGNKRTIRNWLGKYDDGRINLLLDEARGGRLKYCCDSCLITILHSGMAECTFSQLIDARCVRGAWEAEQAYCQFGKGPVREGWPAVMSGKECDALRRRRLIPLLLAEIKRRAYVSNLESHEVPSQELLADCVHG